MIADDKALSDILGLWLVGPQVDGRPLTVLVSRSVTTPAPSVMKSTPPSSTG
jgi:hypothetical protein